LKWLDQKPLAVAALRLNTGDLVGRQGQEGLIVYRTIEFPCPTVRRPLPKWPAWSAAKSA
jgi:hypothetical protein